MDNRKTRYSSASIFQRIIKWPQTGIVVALVILYVLLAIDDNAFYSSSNTINILRRRCSRFSVSERTATHK